MNIHFKLDPEYIIKYKHISGLESFDDHVFLSIDFENMPIIPTIGDFFDLKDSIDKSFFMKFSGISNVKITGRYFLSLEELELFFIPFDVDQCKEVKP